MRDRSLVAFTLLSQLAVGAFWIWGGLQAWAAGQAGASGARAWPAGVLAALGPIMILALLAAFFHLGTPLGGWRALANLRSSWLSREVLCALLFTAGGGLLAGLEWFELGTSAGRGALAWAVALLGLALLACMVGAYRLRTIPAWDTWVTPVSFLTTALLLGGLTVGMALALDASTPPGFLHPVLQWVALGVVVLLGLELVISLLWIAALATEQGAASRAAARITREHGLIFRLRLALAVLAMAVAGASLLPWGEGAARLITLIVAFGLVLASELLGRVLFYEARVRHGV